MNGGILDLSRRLIEALNAGGVGYCSWKQNHELDEALAGGDDVDILISREHFPHFEQIIASLGFKEAVAYVQYPSIFHYYGLDEATGELLHVHAHVQIITGESHVKNYHLPIEGMILDNLRDHPSGCRIPQLEVEWIIFLLRYYIKVSSAVGAMLLRREQASYAAQWRYLGGGIDLRRAASLLEAHLPAVPPALVEELAEALRADAPLVRKVILGLRLRRHLSGFRRFGRIHGFFARYRILGRRVVNKVLMKRKKSLVTGGALVALTGLDGSGKSTHNSALYDWLGPHFNTRRLHVGRPRPCLETLPFRAALNLKGLLRGFTTNLVPVNGGHQGSLFALRYLVLAYERRRCLTRANRLRANGDIILCDRYPSQTPGRMDSPRIVESPEHSPLVNLMARLENRMYRAMPVPDAVFNLKVPLSVALVRNREREKADKESDLELMQRYVENGNLRYAARRFEVIDAARDFPVVVRELRNKLWQNI